MSSRTVWGGVLDSCPGLLCCVINIKGILLHATNGYKAVALRLFGHKCEEGRSYPPLITENDRAIHEALTAACLGEINAIEFTVNGNVWELTASPLVIEGQGLAGVVIRIVSESQAQNVLPQNIQPVIRSNPDILNTVPFRAAMTDKKGVILAVNKFLASCVRADLVGRNIIELVSPELDSELTHILMTSSGSVECTMPDILAAANFCDSMTPYLDEDMNENEAIDSEIDAPRHVRLHATPSEWNGSDSVMLTFEDITDSLKASEQLRRLLTVDRSTGLLNRQGIEHVITRKFHESLSDGGHLSLIMLRVDNYRIIHEAKGFTSAQRIIRDFVRVTLRFLAERGQGVFGRWSEDEFAILTKFSGAAAVTLSNELRSRARDVVISAGVSDVADGGCMSASEFTGAAYDALTEAANSGGNVTVLSHS
ncbi:MAG: GGDEF domain-containing protein [Synergistaceae bacterium]|nr:GGDEF domain-containing protein [Synergistaceae bacterium]